MIRKKTIDNHDNPIILFRGLMGVPFSTGLDKWSKTYENASVHPYGSWKKITKNLIDSYKQGKIKSVSLVGHSLGARVAIKAAHVLRKNKVPVKVVMVLDYVCNVFGINDLAANPYIPHYHFRSKEKLRPRTLKNAMEYFYKDLNHVEIDDDPKVHQLMRRLYKKHNLNK